MNAEESSQYSFNACGGIGKRLNKNCDNKVAEPVEVQFHKVDSLTYTNSCKVQILAEHNDTVV